MVVLNCWSSATCPTPARVLPGPGEGPGEGPERGARAGGGPAQDPAQAAGGGLVG